MTTTRRMVYATIANAVLAGLPEPESQEFGPDAVVRLTFDSHAAATEWARWFGPACEAGGYTADVLDTGRTLRCYHGKRSDWSWQIVGREPIQSLTPQEQEATGVDGNDRPGAWDLLGIDPGREKVSVDPLNLLVPCPRCGHDELTHGEAQGTARVCLGCEGFCRPVVAWNAREPIPAGVDAWPIDGRTR